MKVQPNGFGTLAALHCVLLAFGFFLLIEFNELLYFSIYELGNHINHHIQQ